MLPPMNDRRPPPPLPQQQQSQPQQGPGGPQEDDRDVVEPPERKVDVDENYDDAEEDVKREGKMLSPGKERS